MNAAFESANLLDDLLAQHPQSEALTRFTKERCTHGFAIRQLALEHYYEMRAAVASPVFLLQTKVAQTLERLIPGFQPLYGMVSFSNIPYQDAVDKAQQQSQTIRRVGFFLGLAVIALLGWLIQ
jgi:kynurenine 3-monooxygenase